MPAHRLPAAALALSAFILAACEAPPSTLVPELRQQFQPGLTQAAAESALRQRGTTFSIRSPAECAELTRRSAMASQLPPRGGPCIFGKTIALILLAPVLYLAFVALQHYSRRGGRK